MALLSEWMGPWLFLLCRDGGQLASSWERLLREHKERCPPVCVKQVKAFVRTRCFQSVSQWLRSARELPLLTCLRLQVALSG